MGHLVQVRHCNFEFDENVHMGILLQKNNIYIDTQLRNLVQLSLF